MYSIKEIKEYIRENKTNNFYFTGLKEKTIEEKYQYIKNHFQYDILNSWNRLKSIANNIKIHRIGISNELQNKFFELLNIDYDFLYQELQYYINDFEKMTDTSIFYNGRSDGYLVIVPDFEISRKNQNILEFLGVDDIQYFDTYKEFKQEQNANRNANLQDSYLQEINEAYYILKGFDKLCDILRDELIYILNNYTIEEHEETYTKTVKEIII